MGICFQELLESKLERLLKLSKNQYERQITEAVLINNYKADIIMNKNEEWVAPVTVRLQPI